MTQAQQNEAPTGGEADELASPSRRAPTIVLAAVLGVAVLGALGVDSLAGPGSTAATRRAPSASPAASAPPGTPTALAVLGAIGAAPAGTPTARSAGSAAASRAATPPSPIPVDPSLSGSGPGTRNATPSALGNGALLNGGFETGGLSPWHCDPGVARVGSGSVRSGSFALVLSPTLSSDGQCTQTVAVSPNSTYALKAWIKGGYAYLGASVPGGVSVSTWSPPATGWTLLSTTFTTGAGATSVTVYVHGWYDQAPVAVDDITLTR